MQIWNVCQVSKHGGMLFNLAAKKTLKMSDIYSGKQKRLMHLDFFFFFYIRLAKKHEKVTKRRS